MAIQEGYQISEEERNKIVPSVVKRETSKEIHTRGEAKRRAEMMEFMEEEAAAKDLISALKSSESGTESTVDSGTAEEPEFSEGLPILPTCMPGYTLAHVIPDDGSEAYVDCVSISMMPNVSVGFRKISQNGFQHYLQPEIDKLGGAVIFDSMKGHGTATVLAEDEQALRDLIISWCELDEEI